MNPRGFLNHVSSDRDVLKSDGDIVTSQRTNAVGVRFLRLPSFITVMRIATIRKHRSWA
jgi:hypothetical protein